MIIFISHSILPSFFFFFFFFLLLNSTLAYKILTLTQTHLRKFGVLMHLWDLDVFTCEAVWGNILTIDMLTKTGWLMVNRRSLYKERRVGRYLDLLWKDKEAVDKLLAIFGVFQWLRNLLLERIVLRDWIRRDDTFYRWLPCAGFGKFVNAWIFKQSWSMFYNILWNGTSFSNT